MCGSALAASLFSPVSVFTQFHSLSNDRIHGGQLLHTKKTKAEEGNEESHSSNPKPRERVQEEQCECCMEIRKISLQQTPKSKYLEVALCADGNGDTASLEKKQIREMNQQPLIFQRDLIPSKRRKVIEER